ARSLSGRRGVDRDRRGAPSAARVREDDGGRRYVCPPQRDAHRAARQTPGMRRVRQNWRAVGAPGHLPGMRRRSVLRQLPQPPRLEARAVERTAGGGLVGARGTVAVLLTGRCLRGVLRRGGGSAWTRMNARDIHELPRWRCVAGAVTVTGIAPPPSPRGRIATRSSRPTPSSPLVP